MLPEWGLKKQHLVGWVLFQGVDCMGRKSRVSTVLFLMWYGYTGCIF